MKEKPFYESRTVIVFAMTLAGAILNYVISPEFPVKLTPEIISGIIAAMSIGGIVLRAISDGKITLRSKK